ncbi:MAG TPA: UDP-N-acetylmuramoyl-L-alanyl-D-glutamate--2,6-diaminopimelate ligase, partial [Candidatus Limnocylindrales bacterium]|nr:UDP-N-acetylmuramoyl-L-alanyl-D-glutamate--2,6-diaminopimelate ligase [Candidatus Limnocylindrales bacterium]
AGAALAIVERPVPEVGIPQLVVASSRATLADAAAWWYGDPSERLGVVGVTGTDGKTTTSFLAVAALEAAGLATGLVGTVHLRIGGLEEPTPEHVTTPPAPRLQALLKTMADAGDRAAVLETTSHGLALDRVRGVAYDAAILTNLTHEHLELHGSYEAYRAAKLRLFEALGPADRPETRPDPPAWPRVGIVNRDDPSWSWFADATRTAGARLLTYGTGADADVRALAVDEGVDRLRIEYRSSAGSGRLALQLAGRFNVHNALAIVALGEALGLDPERVRAGLEGVRAIPGRMERIDHGQPFDVVVDFAHSPASLGLVLDLLGPTAADRGGGLIAVFGSAGERDRAKRPMMGRVAGERCRLVVVADEDPRGEDREAILDEIAAGAEAVGRVRGSDLLCIADRRTAIRAAFEAARPGDVVVLAGKGHERSIIGPDGPAPWDEAAVARSLLVELGWRGEGG